MSIIAWASALTTSKTRDFLDSVFDDISSQSFGPGFLVKLSNAVVWKANGTSSMRGRYEGKSTYKEQVLDKLHAPLKGFGQVTIDRIIVDGEWAAVSFHTVGAKARNGLNFGM